VPLFLVFAKNRNVTLAPVIVPKKANDSLVKFNSKRPLNTIENTDNNRIIDAVICAILVDIILKMLTSYYIYMDSLLCRISQHDNCIESDCACNCHAKVNL